MSDRPDVWRAVWKAGWKAGWTSVWKAVWIALAGAALLGCDGADPNGSVEAGQGDVVGTAQQQPQLGKAVYGEYCFSCHGPGLNGAPKLDDVDAWAPRLAKGVELMLQATIAGMPPAMPPRGLCMSCSDEELRAAVVYMSGADG